MVEGIDQGRSEIVSVIQSTGEHETRVMGVRKEKKLEVRHDQDRPVCRAVWSMGGLTVSWRMYRTPAA